MTLVLSKYSTISTYFLQINDAHHFQRLIMLRAHLDSRFFFFFGFIAMISK